MPLALPAPTPEIALAADAEAHWVPFTRGAGNQILFTAELNGRSVTAMLDTGISHSLITAALARRAGLRSARGTGQAQAVGGALSLRWASADRLRIGALAAGHARLAVSAAAEPDRFGADLFVGSDLLACCALDIDYPAGRFRLLPSGRLPFAGIAVPLSQGAAGLPAVRARLNGRTIGPMLIDTGDGAAVTLSQPSWQAAGYAGATITTTLGWGMGGAVVTETAIVPGFALGAAAPRETEIRIEPAGSFGERTGWAGRIGSGWMARYHVLIDPAAGRMVLLPGPDSAAAVPRSTSGLLLGYASDRLKVLHVMRGSPAAEAGWQAGETICAENGVAVAREAPGETAGWVAGPPGMRVTLTLCDGTERALVLRRFY